MYLLRALLHGVGPFEEVEFPFCDESGVARRTVVVHGGGGVGKTSLLGAIASTRPGHCTVQPPRVESLRPGEVPSGAWATCDWYLGQDDPERPHPLVLASPNVKLAGGEERELVRRREQGLFDRVAAEGGFAFLSISATRWFSRQPFAVSTPARTVARYDIKQPLGGDESSRADLARETKQALAYAEIGAALPPLDGVERAELRFDSFGRAMRAVVGELTALVGFRYAGIDPFSWEPMFAELAGSVVPFDALPTRVRHLIAFGALATRVLWAACPDRDPRLTEGVVLIDEVDLHQDESVAVKLPAALRACLPEVQWILTTHSAAVAAVLPAEQVLALRRLPGERRATLFSGNEARTH